MKETLKKVALGALLVISVAAGGYFDHKYLTEDNPNTIDRDVVDAFGETCMVFGGTFSTCQCVLHQASLKMDTDTFHNFNIRFFSEQASPEDTELFKKWGEVCAPPKEEVEEGTIRFREDGSPITL